ncbi:MAG: tetratricopeptide repeat protein [Actinomycetota bacterium]
MRRERDEPGLRPDARRAVARGRAGAGRPGSREAAEAAARARLDQDVAKRFRGSVARKGARVVASPDPERWTGDDRDRRAGAERTEWEPEVWVEEEDEAAEPVPAGAGPSEGPARRPRPRPAVPEEVEAELHDTVDRSQAERVQRRLAEAVRAYERDRYEDALRTLRPVAKLAPASPTVRELHGLTLYRLGRWRSAVKELEAFHALTGSYDQHPVLIDCHRATSRWAAADRAWEELRTASPTPEVLTEGRIVFAASRADRGDLAGAIELLERASTKERPPPLHHLRLWYALADLYERAGDVPRARGLFDKVLQHDASLFDTRERLVALR